MKKLPLFLVIVLMAGNQLIKNETARLVLTICVSLAILIIIAKLIIEKKIILTKPRILMFSFFILLTLITYFYYLQK